MQVSFTSLSEAYPHYYGTTDQDKQKWEYPTSSYFRDTSMARHVRANLETVSQATGAVLLNGEINGNALLIAEDLVLVCAHCFEGEFGRVLFPGHVPGDNLQKLEAITLIDGRSDAQEISHSDFKILQISPITQTPAPLSASPGHGRSLEIYYHSNGAQYIKPYLSQTSRYARRSDYSSKQTYLGESGAPKVSLTSQAVHSIQQGEKEGLKIVDILLTLESIGKTNPHKNKQAQRILDKINVIDFDLRYLYTSTLTLHPLDVIPEGPQHKIPIKRVGQFSKPDVPIKRMYIKDTQDALELKNGIEFDDLWKPSQTLLFYNSIRIDIQKPTATHQNIQIQVNGVHHKKTSIANVLLDKRLSKIKTPNQRQHVLARLKIALTYSLRHAKREDYVIYSLELTWDLD